MDEYFINVVTIVVSVVALLVSIGSLWISALSPFKLQVLNSTPTITVYALQGDPAGASGRTGYVPSIDVSLTLHNLGRRPGIVRAMQFLLTVEARSGARTETFRPAWIVNYVRFHQLSDRLERLDQATELEWYDRLLTGGAESHAHVVFDPVQPNPSWEPADAPMRITMEFQVLSTANRAWHSLGSYIVFLPRAAFGTDSWRAIPVTAENAELVDAVRRERLEVADH